MDTLQVCVSLENWEFIWKKPQTLFFLLFVAYLKP